MKSEYYYFDESNNVSHLFFFLASPLSCHLDSCSFSSDWQSTLLFLPKRQSGWECLLEQTGCVSTLLWKKWYQYLGLTQYHREKNNHHKCSLFYILPLFCSTLQPLSCLPDSFMYTSYFVDFMFVEGSDLSLLIILSPLLLMCAQSMPGDLS